MEFGIDQGNGDNHVYLLWERTPSEYGSGRLVGVYSNEEKAEAVKSLSQFDLSVTHEITIMEVQ